MITRLRILVLLTRPPVALLLSLFAATGAAHAGAGQDPLLLARTLVVVIAYLLFSVAVNDLADQEIDRVNLPGAGSRPLATGLCGTRDMVVVAAVAAATALAGSIHLGHAAVAVTAAGMALSGAYSLRPVRIADRGAVASLLLPAGYVAVPYLLGICAVRAPRAGTDLALLAGLYVGFIGRILLKDFRDVRGDRLFGKRTFLVRHGRRRTCALSAVCWVAGAVALAGVRDLTADVAVAYAASVVAALALLRALAVDGGARRDESIISAVAIVGRGAIVTVVAHLAAVDAGWSAAATRLLLASLVVLTLGQAWLMLVRGPLSRWSVPAAWQAPRAGGSVVAPRDDLAGLSAGSRDAGRFSTCT